jgi:hypothetical protein
VGCTAAAAAEGETKIVQFQVQQGEDVNKLGQYCSDRSSSKGRTDTIRFLVQLGADVNMPLQSGGYSSAIMAAETLPVEETLRLQVRGPAGCIGVHKLTAYRGSTQTQEVAVNGQPYQIV